MANANKRKGSQAERHYAEIFRGLGFGFCKTSRYGSRLHDDAGIDLINLPINVQIKAGHHRGMNVSKVLTDIKQRISEMFPKKAPENTNPLILIHRKQGKSGKRRGEMDDMVHLSFEDFKKLLNMIEWDS